MTDSNTNGSVGSATVAFRLDPFSHDLLEQRARELKLTPGVLAREIVKKALDGDDVRRLLEGVEQVRATLGIVQARAEQAGDKQERLLKTAVAGLLVELGGFSTDQANDWVAYYFADET